MRTRYVSWMMIAMSVVLGCDSRSSVTDPLPLPEEPALSHGAIVGLSTGLGRAELPAGFSLLTFSFLAWQRSNGTADGWFYQKYESASGTVDFTGRVTCLSFDPVNRRSWVGGVITRNNSTNPAVQTAIHQVGRDVWFRVVDNGNGGNAPADRTTVFGFEGAAGFITSAAYCAGQPWAANDANTWPVVKGNLRVLP